MATLTKKGPALAFQMIPLSTSTGQFEFDVVKAFEGNHYLIMPSWGGCSAALNLDGKIFYIGSEELYAYTLARRNGIFEFFSFSGASFSENKIIPALSLAQDTREAALSFASQYDRLQIRGPGQ